MITIESNNVLSNEMFVAEFGEDFSGLVLFRRSGDGNDEIKFRNSELAWKIIGKECVIEFVAIPGDIEIESKEYNIIEVERC